MSAVRCARCDALVPDAEARDHAATCAPAVVEATASRRVGLGKRPRKS